MLDRSQGGRSKTPNDETVHRFRGLLDDLATLTKNTIQPGRDLPTFARVTVPTTLQQRAFDLLRISLIVNGHFARS